MQIQNALLTGSTTVYGPITFVSGSIIGSASYAQTSSYANNFTVGNTLTAQTLVVQTITSSITYSSGSNIFGNQLTNTQTFTGSVNVTGSVNINSSKILIGDDGTYGGYGTIGFGGNSNGFNRIIGGIGTADGLFLNAATTRGIYFRPGGKGTNDVNMLPNGNVGLGVNFILPTAQLHISGSGSGSLMQISSTVSSSIFFVSGSGNIGVGTTTPEKQLTVNYGSTQLGGLLITGSARQETIFRASGEHCFLYLDSFHSNTYFPAINFQRASVTYGVTQLQRASNSDSLGAYTESEMLVGTVSTSSLSLQTSGSRRMVITSAGNVGIGTTTPNEIFFVNTGTGARAGMALTGEYPYLKLNVTSSNANARNWIMTATWAEFGDVCIAQSTAKDVNPLTSGNPIMYFGKTGNVAIGAISPNVKLEVSGSMKVYGGHVGSNNAVTVSSLNVDYLLAPAAYNGIVVIRDNTTGGSGCYLIDPNAGTATISSNVNGTIVFTYNAGSWFIKKTSGTVPTNYTFLILFA